MQRSTIINLAAGAILVILAGALIWRSNGAKIAENSAPAKAALTASLLDSASLQPTLNEKLGTVQLTDGSYSWQNVKGTILQSGRIQLLGDYMVFGDLNNDGKDDAAAIVEEEGKQGSYFSVAAMTNEDGKPVYAGSVYLGDQVRVKSIDIENGVITVDYFAHHTNDYLKYPTLEETLKLKLSGSILKAI